MKKNNTLSKLLWVGIIPMALIAFVVLMILFGIIYGSIKHKDQSVTVNTETEHVCPKPEKVYIHDTVEIRVPSTCKKAHVVAEIKPVSTEGQESNNDSNNSEIKSEN